MAKVLIIDDNELMCQTLALKMRKMGHCSESAYCLFDGLMLAEAQPFDVVFLDVGLPDGDGLSAIEALHHGPGNPEVIIITGQGSADGAEIAISRGAWDYVLKGASLNAMVLPLVRAVQYRAHRPTDSALDDMDRGGIIGDSAPLRACLETVAQAAQSTVSVLITGETGTGKELFARALHNNSPRRSGPFIVLDCAAVPEKLMESTLFGHERGAFTGAERDQIGLIEQADGGTLFLDEIGELPLALQRAFLRVLQERRFRRIGSAKERASDFRLVTATHRDLTAMAQTGAFREDMLFRVRAIHVELPPLRGRPADIQALVAHHLPRICSRFGTSEKTLTPETCDALGAYDWPGNVRELIHVLEQAVVTARRAPELYPAHLSAPLRIHAARAAVTPKLVAPPLSGLPAGPPTNPIVVPVYTLATLPQLKQVRQAAIEDAERRYLRQLMALTLGDVRTACKASGLSQSRLYALLQKHGISRRRPS